MVNWVVGEKTKPQCLLVNNLFAFEPKTSAHINETSRKEWKQWKCHGQCVLFIAEPWKVLSSLLVLFLSLRSHKRDNKANQVVVTVKLITIHFYPVDFFTFVCVSVCVCRDAVHLSGFIHNWTPEKLVPHNRKCKLHEIEKQKLDQRRQHKGKSKGSRTESRMTKIKNNNKKTKDNK